MEENGSSPSTESYRNTCTAEAVNLLLCAGERAGLSPKILWCQDNLLEMTNADSRGKKEEYVVD